MTPDQFAQAIKQKYPAYANVDNNTLVSKMLEKYPQYKDKVQMNAAPAPAAPSQPDLLSRAASTVNSIFPGKQIGEGLSNSVDFLGSLAKGDLQGAQSAANRNDAMAPRIFADAANSVATAGSMAIGGVGTKAAPAGAGFLTRAAYKALPVAANAGINATAGAIQGGANAAANGGDVSQGAQSGAAVGGIASLTGDALSKVLSSLPSRLVKGALPKLKPGMEKYALEKTPLGSLSTMTDANKTARSSLNDKINTLLSGKYKDVTGDGSASLTNTLSKFKDSALENEADIATALKDVAPAKAKLIDKLAKGTATLADKNEIRREIDDNTFKQHGDLPKLTFNKEVAHEVADNLRAEVQKHATETAGLFKEYSSEINLGKALRQAKDAADKRSGRLTFFDLLSFLGGLAGTASLPGAASAVAGERLARAPGTAIAIAKGINKGNQAAPSIGKIARLAKPLLVKQLTNQAQE